MAAVEGKKAPSFTLMGDDGNKHKLGDLKGKRVIVYFYPRDNTPGCTREAVSFRDNMDRINGSNAVVYGISKDNLVSHERFSDSQALNFVLLSDTDLAVHKRYEAYGQKLVYGKERIGVIRSTFIIDEEGIVAKIWRGVKVKGHIDQVLEALDAMDAGDEPEAEEEAPAEESA